MQPAETEIPRSWQLSVFELLAGMWQSRVLCVATRLCVADALADGPLLPSELAEITRTHEGALRRLLRAAARLGVFREVSGGRFVNTELSNLLRQGVPGSMHGIAMGIDSWGWRAWGELEHSVRTGEPAFDKVHGMPLFDYFAAEDPEAGTLFDQSMDGFSESVEKSVSRAAELHDARTVVDVGGGYGGLMRTVLRDYPSIDKGIVFDQPHVIGSAAASGSDSDSDGRLYRQAGDFFVAVPPNADVYLTKWILHDWDDDRVVQILLNCRRAMNPGGRILAAETVLGTDHTSPLAYLMDLQMMVNLTGKERSEAEFRELYERAGLRLTRIIPAGSLLSLVEGVRA